LSQRNEMTPKSKDVNKASWFQNPVWKGTASAVPMKPTKGAGFSPWGSLLKLQNHFETSCS
jgi:hypothetical protein